MKERPTPQSLVVAPAEPDLLQRQETTQVGAVHAVDSSGGTRKRSRRENKEALETFNFAKAAEAEHAKMYTEALNTLDALKGSKATSYYVCTVCGFTTVKLDFQKCPVCFNSKDKYTSVS